jgi:NAD(P)-dependent dehydrogenase (short-subunit alcohol dehydrogenase family)
MAQDPQSSPAVSLGSPASPRPVPRVRDLLDLSGQVALVTGAGSGFGRTIARRLAEAGARVAVHYRGSRDGAQAVVAEIRAAAGQARAFAGDLTLGGEAARVVDEVSEAFGRLDVLVNNAGTYPLSGLLKVTAAEWDLVLAANLKTALLALQAAAPRMRATGGGAIVNVTTIQAFRTAEALAHYSAAKAGLEMLTRSAAVELGPSGIRVNAVAPGLIWREGIEAAWPDGVARYRAAAPLRRIGQPEDVADACLFLASPAARFITGASLTVDGGVLAGPAF